MPSQHRCCCHGLFASLLDFGARTLRQLLLRSNFLTVRYVSVDLLPGGNLADSGVRQRCQLQSLTQVLSESSVPARKYPLENGKVGSIEVADEEVAPLGHDSKDAPVDTLQCVNLKLGTKDPRPVAGKLCDVLGVYCSWVYTSCPSAVTLDAGKKILLSLPRILGAPHRGTPRHFVFKGGLFNTFFTHCTSKDGRTLRATRKVGGAGRISRAVFIECNCFARNYTSRNVIIVRTPSHYPLVSWG